MMEKRKALRYNDTELMQRAGTLVEKLSPEHRIILQAQGNYVERAQALGIALGTVRSRLNRARKELQRLIDERGPQA